MAKLAADGFGVHGKAFIRAAGIHFKCFRLPARCLLRKACCCIHNGIPILLHRYRRADGMHAKHAGKRIAGILNPVFRHAMHVDAPLFAAHRSAKAAQRVVDAFDQFALKEGAVKPLEMNLAIADEQNLFHCKPPKLFLM